MENRLKLSQRILIPLFIMFIISPVLSATSERDLPQQPVLNLKKINRLILEFTNNERIKHKLTPFILNDTLQKAAQIQSDYMKSRGQISHYGGKYPTPRDRVKASCGKEITKCMKKFTETPRPGKRYLICCGENVIESSSRTDNMISYRLMKDKKGSYRLWQRDVEWFNEKNLARDMVNRWMKSPPHRRNILNKKYTIMGTAVSWNGKNTYYGTQVFSPIQTNN